MLIPRAPFVGNTAASIAAPTSSSDTDVQAWITAVRNAGAGVSQAYANALTTMVAGMKSDGQWASLEVAFPFGAENATQAGIDLVTRLTLTPVLSPTFTPLQGFRGDGAASYLNLNWTVGSGGKFVQDNAGVGLYVAADDSRGSGTSRAFCGADEAGGTSRVFIHRGSSGSTLSVAMNNIGNDSPSLSSYVGLLHHERTGASVTATYQNGSLKGTGALSSVAVASQTMFVLAGNQGGAPIQFTDARMLFFYGGASLGSSGVSVISLRVSAFLSAIGAS